MAHWILETLIKMLSAIHSLKRSLRKELKARIKRMPDDQKREESLKIAKKVLNLKAYQESSRVSVYLSMPSEVDTTEILNHIFDQGKKCYVPLYTSEDMKMVRLKDLNDYNSLPLTSWNIKQPNENEVREIAIESGGLDMVIVPGLGFTSDGLRIGRGKGYYDNYLKKHFEKIGKKPLTVGLAFSVQICNEIPYTDNDVKLDMVLHPE